MKARWRGSDDLSSGKTFGSLIESEIARWGKVVEGNHIYAGISNRSILRRAQRFRAALTPP
jgi:hypothetical protein